MILFKKVKDKYGWFSNMSPHPVETFRTAEAYFQSLRFNDPAIVEAIKAEKSPMAAKMVAKKYLDKAIVQPRSPADIENMRATVGLKLKCHPDLVAKLLETSDEQIIEDVSARQNESGLFWGAARITEEAREYMERLGLPVYSEGGESWYGNNVLGKIWMEHRAQLAARELFTASPASFGEAALAALTK